MTRDTTHPTILIVDDEETVLDLIARFAEDAGFKVVTCSSGAEALEKLKHQRADVAAVDLRLPDVGGIEVLRAIREADPDCQVILMSGDATIDSAVEAVKLGAIDYLTKPFDFARLTHLLTVVRDEAARRGRLLQAEQEVAKNAEFCGMVGRSPVMQELFGLIRRLAPHVRTVLVTGETGSGKELVARALHRYGPRGSKRFVAINCSAVVETLFESELFGHMRGAFTGATDNKPGLFEVANGGTLFLDEIGELPQVMQAKLLRVLETGEVQRVGSVSPTKVDVHVVAATNRDLRAESEAGHFRSDLFYRLNVVELRVPALRERREDIPYLTAAFVQESAMRFNKKIVGLTPSAERILVSGTWNGNVRELRNVVERACILADSEFISEREFASSLSQNGSPARQAVAVRGLQDDAAQAAGDALSTVERDHILDVLARAGGNKAKAARILGLDRRSLYRRLDAYGLRGDTPDAD
ncbi:MAG TPA: sigma-54 dependent transcriptional regulator [Vicinamibacterales bacterium]|nr:sigma-54 dependent transcriptional regulator [Vicinamibacterales bacterium]